MAEPQTYNVQAGDSLSRIIEREFGVQAGTERFAELLQEAVRLNETKFSQRANGEDTIYAGEDLLLPASELAQAPEITETVAPPSRKPENLGEAVAEAAPVASEPEIAETETPEVESAEVETATQSAPVRSANLTGMSVGSAGPANVMMQGLGSMDVGGVSAMAELRLPQLNWASFELPSRPVQVQASEPATVAVAERSGPNIGEWWGNVVQGARERFGLNRDDAPEEPSLTREEMNARIEAEMDSALERVNTQAMSNIEADISARLDAETTASLAGLGAALQPQPEPETPRGFVFVGRDADYARGDIVDLRRDPELFRALQEYIRDEMDNGQAWFGERDGRAESLLADFAGDRYQPRDAIAQTFDDGTTYRAYMANWKREHADEYPAFFHEPDHALIPREILDAIGFDLARVERDPTRGLNAEAVAELADELALPLNTEQTLALERGLTLAGYYTPQRLGDGSIGFTGQLEGNDALREAIAAYETQELGYDSATGVAHYQLMLALENRVQDYFVARVDAAQANEAELFTLKNDNVNMSQPLRDGLSTTLVAYEAMYGVRLGYREGPDGQEIDNPMVVTDAENSVESRAALYRSVGLSGSQWRAQQTTHTGHDHDGDGVGGYAIDLRTHRTGREAEGFERVIDDVEVARLEALVGQRGTFWQRRENGVMQSGGVTQVLDETDRTRGSAPHVHLELQPFENDNEYVRETTIRGVAGDMFAGPLRLDAADYWRGEEARLDAGRSEQLIGEVLAEEARIEAEEASLAQVEEESPNTPNLGDRIMGLFR